jgi:hypothetical protein
VFERAHHQCIAHVLRSLDADQLRAHQCYFGGGTAIVLGHGEYRESIDMDFMVSEINGYRGLRKILGSAAGIRPLLRDANALEQLRDIRADQYGARTLLAVAGSKIKFEIIFEARIDLDRPQPQDEICGISTLTALDMAATKLLANSDRWADDGVFNRDVIDLAMLELTPDVWRAAVEKAENAYGDAVRRDLGNAIERLKAREGWLDRCIQALSINLPKAMLWERLRALHRRLEG